ncbi:toxin-antitoxin system HicB family antitoxin [bacterium SPL81]|nr:toxin-antitoxin system HicB family antitoxin [Acinetobacter baumannii]
MEKSRPLNQENWKRTQVRLPPELHDEIINFAASKDISLNNAMLELLSAGIENFNENSKGYKLSSILFHPEDGTYTDQKQLRAKANTKANNFFNKNKEYKPINFQLIEEGLMCWYHKPKTNHEE